MQPWKRCPIRSFACAHAQVHDVRFGIGQRLNSLGILLAVERDADDDLSRTSERLQFFVETLKRTYFSCRILFL